MIVLFPLVYPMGKILDCILGDEVGNTYNRKQLKKLIEIHSEQDIREKYGQTGIDKSDFILLKVF
jgi:hypothetical protein